MEKRIYPYLISEQQMIGYYEILLDQKYAVKIFEAKNDKEIYDNFLPHMKNYMFWTFNISNSNISNVNKKEFSKMPNDIKAAICGDYTCNVFEKGESLIVCFKSGICFAITDNDKEAKKVKKFEAELQMKAINLRDEDTYEVPKKAKNSDLYMYLYVLELYKMIFMNKVHKNLQVSGMMDKARNDFVDFIEKVYNTKTTDNAECIKQCEKWDEELELEKNHIKIDNEFDLIYRNNKMNHDKSIKIWCLVLLITAIIIGMINLWGMMQ